MSGLLKHPRLALPPLARAHMTALRDYVRSQGGSLDLAGDRWRTLTYTLGLTRKQIEAAANNLASAELAELTADAYGVTITLKQPDEQGAG